MVRSAAAYVAGGAARSRWQALRLPDRLQPQHKAAADETSAKAAVPACVSDSGDWRLDFCLPGISIYTVAPGVDTDGNPIEVRTYVPGFHVDMALTAVRTDLCPPPACRLIADRAAAIRGEPFLRYVAPDLDQTILAKGKIEPTFAGSNYPFGGQ